LLSRLSRFQLVVLFGLVNPGMLFPEIDIRQPTSWELLRLEITETEEARASDLNTSWPMSQIAGQSDSESNIRASVR
jgi:hypothetical protein